MLYRIKIVWRYFMGLKPQGIETSPIWLIGDSDPKKWGPPDLEYVFDDRHPTIHNIWTSIIYKVQKLTYKQTGKMIDDEQFYIRNAIEQANMRPGQDDRSWDGPVIGKDKADYLRDQMENMKKLFNENKPKMIITFGAFSFEFTRRCYDLVNNPFGNWNTKALRGEFVNSINNKKIIVPLLHRSISMGHFLSSHNQFSDDAKKININGNYFKYVSEKLSQRIIGILNM
jgi:hypothetical protein